MVDLPMSTLDAGTPGSHQTVTRVTRILEEVVYRPGLTLADLTRILDAPKSSVYGFVKGLIAVDWLYELDHKLYLGPAFFSLAIASGHIRAGVVTAADLDELHRESGLTAFVGVRAGEHLLYIAEAGSDLLSGFEARGDIRRDMLTTAGGKALLAALPEDEAIAFLRSRPAHQEADVAAFLDECPSIRTSRVAVNVSTSRSRTGIGTAIIGPAGHPVASVTLVGATATVVSRRDELEALLVTRVDSWRRRSAASSREPI